ncbi:MAG: Asp-tRNA(Asn)/Glu-tRNA(Gln) amidotransferase subunit GatA [Oscillospiraceae bacterium]
MSIELYKKTATELAAMLRTKEVSATEIASDAISRIKTIDKDVKAYLNITEEKALEAAAVTDKKIANNETIGALAGIPIAIKDNICTRGIKTTCASKMLEDFVPPYNATVIDKLISQNITITGKVNMDEFAMGSSCENSYFGATRNPWDLSRVPGGSSGGSAAAVAACEVPLSLGSDTGGSVRCPAALCGIVGLKPTYGAVSRYGLVAFASSLDQIGVFARTTKDASLLFNEIAAQDKAHDATSKAFTYDGIKQNIKGLKIGLPKEYFQDGISDEVKQSVMNAARLLTQQGAELVDISLPSTNYALSAYYIISSAEASSNLARYDGVKYGLSVGRTGSLNDMYLATRSEGFGKEVKRRIMLGTYVLSSGYFDAYYKRAKMLQRQISAEFTDAFTKCDVLLTPTTPYTAFKLGEKVSDPLAMYAADICTVTVNIVGLPAVSVPCGMGEGALPIGMQLIGPKFSESRILTVADCYETLCGGFAVKEL